MKVQKNWSGSEKLSCSLHDTEEREFSSEFPTELFAIWQQSEKVEVEKY